MKNKKLTLEDMKEYASKNKKEWILWAKKEIKEYEKFIKFLEESK